MAKIGFIGLRLNYEWGISDLTTKTPRVLQGIGAGIILWLTEE